MVPRPTGGHTTMRRKAILLTLQHDNEEMEELVYALGSQLVDVCRQRRAQADAQFHLGRGKLDEARAMLVDSGASLVVVNASLKPNQIFNLQQFFGDPQATGGRLRDDGHDIEVYDRTRLILEIFRQRAQSPEARLQVELAQIHYEMPLVKEYIHLAKKGEHPGFLAGGEYEVNQYHDMMKRRMARIRRELQKMRRERGLRRKHRRRGGCHLVSLAGYTNAGKSSLLQALADSPTLTENRYFSTLSTKTRRASSDKRDILVTDTVGFIEDLPPWMVEAFHSTLEEIGAADVTLLVVDASDPVEEVARRLRSSLRILWQFHSDAAARGLAAEGSQPKRGSARDRNTPGSARPRKRSARKDVASAAREEGAAGDFGDGFGGGAGAPVLIVFNKVDRLASGEKARTEEEGVAVHETPAKKASSTEIADGLAERIAALAEDGLVSPTPEGDGGACGWIAVSATSGEGLDGLYERLYQLLPTYDSYETHLPEGDETEALLAWLHEHTDVLSVDRITDVDAQNVDTEGIEEGGSAGASRSSSEANSNVWVMRPVRVRFEAKTRLQNTIRKRLVLAHAASPEEAMKRPQDAQHS